MKVRLFTDYTKPMGFIETDDDDKLVVEPEGDFEPASLEGMCEFYASQIYHERLDAGGEDGEGLLPGGEEILTRMADHMQDGKRCWCEVQGEGMDDDETEDEIDEDEEDS